MSNNAMIASRMILRGTGTVAVAFAAISFAPHSSAQTTFRTTTNTVAIYPRVQDERGGLIPDLIQSDFQITEDGHAVPISLFSNERQPITAAVMLDTSSS